MNSEIKEIFDNLCLLYICYFYDVSFFADDIIAKAKNNLIKLGYLNNPYDMDEVAKLYKMLVLDYLQDRKIDEKTIEEKYLNNSIIYSTNYSLPNKRLNNIYGIVPEEDPMIAFKSFNDLEKYTDECINESVKRFSNIYNTQK